MKYAVFTFFYCKLCLLHSKPCGPVVLTFYAILSVSLTPSCISSSFYNPTGSIQVEAESGPNEDLVTDDVPPNILGTNIKVIKMDRDLVGAPLQILKWCGITQISMLPPSYNMCI